MLPDLKVYFVGEEHSEKTKILFAKPSAKYSVMLWTISALASEMDFWRIPLREPRKEGFLMTPLERL